jgi:cation transport regulator ChaB
MNGGGIAHDVAWTAIQILLNAALAALPQNIRDSLFAKAVDAIGKAKDAAQVELEITAVLNEVKVYLENAAGDIHV